MAALMKASTAPSGDVAPVCGPDAIGRQAEARNSSTAIERFT
jgi:hypothetical protein